MSHIIQLYMNASQTILKFCRVITINTGQLVNSDKQLTKLLHFCVREMHTLHLQTGQNSHVGDRCRLSAVKVLQAAFARQLH